MEAVQGPVMVHVYCSLFPEMECVHEGRGRGHRSPEHGLEDFFFMLVTQEVYLHIKF